MLVSVARKPGRCLSLFLLLSPSRLDIQKADQEGPRIGERGHFLEVSTTLQTSEWTGMFAIPHSASHCLAGAVLETQGCPKHCWEGVAWTVEVWPS